MKQQFVSVLCLLLIAGMVLCACGKSGSQDVSNSKYIGSWKAVTISFKDLTDDYTDECTLTLNGDGTAVFFIEGEETRCGWEETGSGLKLTGESKMSFTADGDALLFKIAGSELRFERQ